MRKIFFAFVVMCALDGFSQTSEMIIEEKSSTWIKVTASTPASISPKPATTTKKRITTKKPAPAKPQLSNKEFDKTNQQVNRFRKKEK